MKRRAVPFRLPLLAQDALLGLFVAVMQVQGITAATPEVGSRPPTHLGYLGYVLLIVSGLVLAVRRRWPVAVFATAVLVSLVYFVVGFSDGPVWIGLFVALYTLTAYGDGRRSLVIAGAWASPCWLPAGSSPRSTSSPRPRSDGCSSGSRRPSWPLQLASRSGRGGPSRPKR